MSIDIKCRVRVAPHTLVNFIEDESYLVHLHSQETFHLSKLGTEIWDILIRSDSIEQALAIFTQTTPLDFERVNQDLLELLDQLRWRDLIVITPPNEAADGLAGTSAS
jgi:hypothetical protein